MSETRSSAVRSSWPAVLERRNPTGSLLGADGAFGRDRRDGGRAGRDIGPVVPILRISSDEEALQIANASPYGLLTAVWTQDLAADCALPRPSTRLG